jgi:hypothetical protein
MVNHRLRKYPSVVLATPKGALPCVVHRVLFVMVVRTGRSHVDPSPGVLVLINRPIQGARITQRFC